MRFSKKPFNKTKQKKGADTFEKFKIFTRFWCVMCVLIYDF
tara:strand:- start:974 stop:1096 length:123 start_codon:yes stop_codon:yes gene_type:complete